MCCLFFAWLAHDESTHPGKSSKLQTMSRRGLGEMNSSRTGQATCGICGELFPWKLRSCVNRGIEERNVWREPDSVVHFLGCIWGSSLPSLSAAYAFYLLTLQCKKEDLASSSRVVLPSGHRALRCPPLRHTISCVQTLLPGSFINSIQSYTQAHIACLCTRATSYSPSCTKASWNGNITQLHAC